MEITLITPTPPDISAFGVRIISACLKKAGFSTKTIFLPGGIAHLEHGGGYVYQYSEKIVKQILEISQNSNLVGVSFMTQYFDRAVQVTKAIRKRNIPVIWGGIHPIHCPEEALRYADIACIGEGEEAMLELAERMEKGIDYYNIKNLWFRKNGDIIRNVKRPLIPNLDELPFFDFALENSYIYDLEKDGICEMDTNLFKRSLPLLRDINGDLKISYRTMTSRGCPHKCTYCASSVMGILRRRSIDNVIRELVEIKNKYPFIELINFFDDTFFGGKEEFFEEFGKKYKERIGLPFHAQCSPTTITEKKLESLIEAGLVFTEMGIQTGSSRIKQLYRRPTSNKKTLEMARLINKYSHKLLPPDYHIILDNPWERKEDVRDTLDVILKLPRPYRLQISSLVLFPGTGLHKKAKAEGLIKDEIREIYRKPFLHPQGTFLNYLIYLAGFCYFPRGLLKLLSRKCVSRLFNLGNRIKLYNVLFWLTERIVLFKKGIISLTHGDLGRIRQYFLRQKTI